MRRFVRWSLPFLTMACVHDSPVAPLTREAPIPARSVAGPLGSKTLPVRPYNAPWDDANRVLADTFVYGAIPPNATIRVRVSGTVTLGPNPLLSGGVITMGTSFMGQSIGPQGLVGVYSPGDVGTQLQVLAGIANPSHGLTMDSATSGVSTFRTGPTGGALVLRRNGISGVWTCMSPQPNPPNSPPPETCFDPDKKRAWTHPGYLRTSQQIVSVERLDDDVTLNAVASTGGKGRSVTYTAVPLATNGAGGPMGWTFTPDGGTAATAACQQGNSVNPCVAILNATGWMDVNWYFHTPFPDGSSNRHARTHVWAVDCPQTDTATPHDSLVNRDDTRREMKSVYDSSGPNLDIYHKHETGEFVYRDPDADTLIVIHWDTPSDPCSITVPQWPPEPPLWQMVAILHSHPAAPGDTLPPNVCTLNPKNRKGGQIGPGPSDDDDGIYDEAGVSVYAVDRNAVWRTNGRGHHVNWSRYSSCTLL